MINSIDFLALVDETLGRNLRHPDNQAQADGITQRLDPILHLVAGPGSGKTSVLVLRALHFVYVENLLPESILMTTFTRRAARELRSRWLDWGGTLHKELSLRHDLDHVDLNRCRIDTLDSTIHSVLTEFRELGTTPPGVTDPATTLLILRRGAFASHYYSMRDAIAELLARHSFDGRPPRNQAAALGETKRLLERLVQDRVDLDSYAAESEAEAAVVEMLIAHKDEALRTNLFDFSLLEEKFLDRLEVGALDNWLGHLRAILVDEYQDTNPLQEAIYFHLLRNHALSGTVVGDDDQAMYRFRGGSVELFTEFASRCRATTDRTPRRVDLTRNFRSRPEIIEFVNAHISADPGYQTARVQPAKAPVLATRQAGRIPVLGMFRDDEQVLASDLAQFLETLTQERAVYLDACDEQLVLAEGGDLGDVVFLSHSVNELEYNRYNGELIVRFPSLLREQMERCGLRIFNPRGRALRTLDDVGRLLGLLLLAIDPLQSTVDEMRTNNQLTNEAHSALTRWRDLAEEFVDSNPNPSQRAGLGGYIEAWQHVSSGGVASSFPADFPVLELLFALVTWFPQFQREPEHQVWLEAIARIIASSAGVSPYQMRLLQNDGRRNQGVHLIRSRQSLIRDALVPIALDEMQVDEDIMPSVPRDMLQLMTIHQAKGLEFPLVIVDVGTRFRTDHPMHRFRRFPDKVSNVVIAEDDMEPHLSAELRGHRVAIDRTFDDLTRLYYVSFSRAQCVLLLVGHENQLRYNTNTKNIALGWRRDENWSWHQPSGQRKSPVTVSTPFLEI